MTSRPGWFFKHVSTSIPGHFDPDGPRTDLFSARPAPVPATHAAAATRRRLHKGHFAFMRAIVQGVDWQVAWDRYLRWEEEGGDARAMRATIAWLRDEFAAAARREARFGTARLVLIDAARVPDNPAPLPTLEDFVDQRGLEDFPQAEQIALFEAEFGRASQRQRRRARLIARQLEALAWIEQQVAQPPRAGDSVAYWLNPLLVAPLQEAGLGTLGALRDDIDGRGPHWYRRLRGIGATKAARIAAWLGAHRGGLYTAATAAPPVAKPRGEGAADPAWLPAGAAGLRPAGGSDRPPEGGRHRFGPLAAGVAQEVRPAEPAPSMAFMPPAGPPSSPAVARIATATATAGAPGIRSAPHAGPILLRPLDRFVLPPSVDGGHRHGAGLPGAAAPAFRDDREAIDAWLGEAGVPGGAAPRPAHTRRAYHREAERFLLWCVIERGRSLSSVDAADCLAYRAFIADPQPRDRWCVRPSPGRQSPLWRPFAGPLGPAGQRQAVAALSSLFGFLVDRGHRQTHPWRQRVAADPSLPAASRASDRAERPDAAPGRHAPPLAASSPLRGAQTPLAAAVPVLAAAHGPAPRGAAKPLDAARSLSPRLWSMVLARADALPPTGTHHRLRFALRWLYATGLRLSEAADARLGDLHQAAPEGAGRGWSAGDRAGSEQGSDSGSHSDSNPGRNSGRNSGSNSGNDGGGDGGSDGGSEPGSESDAAPAGPSRGWWLRVRGGSSGRVRELPLPEDLIVALREYLATRGLDPDPTAPAQREVFVLGQSAERGERASRLPCPGPVDVRRGVRPSTLARQLKQHFGACAAACAEAGDAAAAKHLANASAHWLRHTHARHLLANGLPLALAQQHLGHAARSTTAAYLVPERPPGRPDWQAAWDATIAAQRRRVQEPGEPAAAVEPAEAAAARSTEDPGEQAPR